MCLNKLAQTIGLAKVRPFLLGYGKEFYFGFSNV